MGIITHVAVTSEVLEQLDLSQSALGEDLLAENVGDLLDGDTLTGVSICRGADIVRTMNSIKTKTNAPE